MKLEDAIKELTLLREEHGNVDLYVSVDLKPWKENIEKGNLGPVSAARYIVYEECEFKDGSGIDRTVTIRDWPY